MIASQVLLFDVGGVLVELGGMEQMLEWTEHRWRPDEIMRRWFCSPTVRAFETGQCAPDEFARAIVIELQIAASPAEFLRVYSTWLSQLYPGAIELLTGLRDRFLLASLSNTNQLHWSRIRDDMGLGPLFHHHFPSHETGRIKPDRDAFEQVIEALDVPATAISFFDDTVANVAAAAALGIRAYHTRGVRELTRVLRSLRLR